MKKWPSFVFQFYTTLHPGNDDRSVLNKVALIIENIKCKKLMFKKWIYIQINAKKETR